MYLHPMHTEYQRLARAERARRQRNKYLLLGLACYSMAAGLFFFVPRFF